MRAESARYTYVPPQPAVPPAAPQVNLLRNQNFRQVITGKLQLPEGCEIIENGQDYPKIRYGEGYFHWKLSEFHLKRDEIKTFWDFNSNKWKNDAKEAIKNLLETPAFSKSLPSCFMKTRFEKSTNASKTLLKVEYTCKFDYCGTM